MVTLGNNAFANLNDVGATAVRAVVAYLSQPAAFIKLIRFGLDSACLFPLPYSLASLTWFVVQISVRMLGASWAGLPP